MRFRNGSTREHRVCPRDRSLKCQMRIKTFPSPASSSGRPSRTCVERKTLASGIFPCVHVNHLYGLWLGSRNERIVVQQQNRFDYPHELTRSAILQRFLLSEQRGLSKQNISKQRKYIIVSSECQFLGGCLVVS